MRRRTIAALTLLAFMMLFVCDVGNNIKPELAYMYGAFGVGFMFFAIYWRYWRNRRW